MEGQHPHVGAFAEQRTYDRRGASRDEDLELPTFIRNERQGERASDLLGNLLSLGSLAKAIGAGALVILGWTGAKITSGNERTTRLEAYMERSAPVLEFLGRETCANIPASEYPRRAPLCPQLMGAPGYLSRPQADLAPADGSFTSSVANLGGDPLMHEGPFSFHAKLPQPDVRVFCPRADCDYSDEMQPVDAAIAETIPCPKCLHLGVTSVVKTGAP